MKMRVTSEVQLRIVVTGSVFGGRRPISAVNPSSGPKRQTATGTCNLPEGRRLAGSNFWFLDCQRLGANRPMLRQAIYLARNVRFFNTVAEDFANHRG